MECWFLDRWHQCDADKGQDNCDDCDATWPEAQTMFDVGISQITEVCTIQVHSTHTCMHYIT